MRTKAHSATAAKASTLPRSSCRRTTGTASASPWRWAMWTADVGGSQQRRGRDISAGM